MISWCKLMGWGRMILPNLIYIIAVSDCGTPHTCLPPGLTSASPNVGNQGDIIEVTLTGSNFSLPEGCSPGDPVVQVDAYNYGLFVDPPTSYDSTSITFNLHIASDAYRGTHWISVRNNEGISALTPFFVTCPGCPPPPVLFSVVSHNGDKLVPGGTVTFTFEGVNLLNHNPRGQIDGFDVHVAPGPYNVQSNGSFDYFSADITADPTAAGSVHQVYITADGGNSNPVYITVDASQPPPSPNPGGTPSLNGITPSHITRFASQFTNVSVKFEGTGFGTNHEILVDPNSTVSGFSALNEYQADRDKVVIGLPQMNLPTGPDTSVTVRVLNHDNGTVSNPQILFLDDPAPNAPVVTTAYFVGGPLHQNSFADLYLEGQNLQGLTAQTYQNCFSGIAGLSFSDFVRWTDGTFQVRVHTDASAPLSADEVTNLIITTADGQSNPFWIQILPP